MRQLLWMLSFFLIATLVFDLSAAACASSGQDTSITTYYKSSYSGKGTFYDYKGTGGHCTIDPSPYIVTSSNKIYATVAIASAIYQGTNSGVCGMCLNVTATGVGSGTTPLKGNYLVFVNNECPTCDGASSIDFGVNGDGVWDVSWVAVPCPVGSSLISYIFQGSNPYYIKLQAMNTRYPVKSISVKVSGAYKALTRTIDNFFQLSATFTFPLEVQLTSINGDVVTDSIAAITTTPVTGTVQFPLCDSSSTSSSSATTTASSSTASSTTKSSTSTTASSTTKSSTTTTASSGSTTSSPSSSLTTDGSAIKDSGASASLVSFVFVAVAACLVLVL